MTKEKLTASEIKQIAGRAGRAKTIGYVTATSKEDLKYIKECLGNENNILSNGEIIEQILIKDQKTINYNFLDYESSVSKAGLFPPSHVFVEFSKILNHYFNKKHKLDELIENFKLFLPNLDNKYFLTKFDRHIEIANALKNVEGSDLETQYTFLLSPIKLSKYTLLYLKTILEDFTKKRLVLVPEDFYFPREKIPNFTNYVDFLNLLERIYNSIFIK